MTESNLLRYPKNCSSELDNNKNYKFYFQNKAFLRKNKLPPEAKTLEGFLFSFCDR